MIPIEGVLEKYEVEFDESKGGNQKIKCPFHPDTVASASVNLELGLFNCYGCDVRGDAISLLMQQEGLTFSESKRLAEELAGGARPALSRRPERRGSLLPGRARSGKGHGGFKSPWAGRRS